jgi:Dolichyl-phosphate-mannose-protein mannosyltransferase
VMPLTLLQVLQLVLRALSILCTLTATYVTVTGGFVVSLAGLTLRAHRPFRLWLIGILFAVVSERIIGLPPKDVSRTLRTIGARAVAIAIVSAPLAIGIAYGTEVAGGADSAGYVSQARMWADGHRQLPSPPFASAEAWPAGALTLTPLGWRPTLAGGTMAPTYAPGLPLLMAAFAQIGNGWGLWLVVPLLGAVAVGATMSIGRAMAGRVGGWLAGILLVVSPTFASQLVQPMSDVPVAAWWTLAIALVARSATTTTTIASGLAASAAILTRPNLAPIVLPFLWFLARERGVHPRTSARHIAWFALSAAPGAIVAGWLNAVWYASPLRSGYGSLSDLFHVSHGIVNLRRYPVWLAETHTPFIFLGLFAPLAIWLAHRYAPPAAIEESDVEHDRHRARLLAWLCLGVIATNVACYTFYAPFESSTYLRFLLPSIPLSLALGVATLWWGLVRLPWRLGPIVACVLCGGLAVRYATSPAFAGIRHTFIGEQRYPQMAAYVREALPERAALFAMQHSGSLAYYTDRPIVRWDWLDGPWLDRACAALRARGYAPYFVLEEWEEALFKARFAGHSEFGALDWAPRAESRHRPIVRLYDPSQRMKTPPTSRPPVRVLP